MAVVGAEMAFRLLIALGLVTRYLLGLPRVGAALLAATPLIDLALLAFVVIDLRAGAEPAWTHGLGAVYPGFSVACGRRLVRWADARFRARREGRLPPPPSKRYSAERIRHEWRETGVFSVGAGIAIAVLLTCSVLVDDLDRAQPLLSWAGTLLVIAAISLLWPISYMIWPPQPPRPEEPSA